MEIQMAQADRLASMGLVAAGIAHEINTPLAYVLFNLETLTQDLPLLFATRGSLLSGGPPGLGYPGDGNGAASTAIDVTDFTE
jgi:signal transduction histidine kinase